MTYNLQTIQSRLQRIEEYFPNPKLRSIITGGVSEMATDKIGNKEVHRGLEEGTWSRNLLRWVADRTNTDPGKFTVIREYITTFSALEERKEWGKWGVDSANNAHAPIWVRLVDKLQRSIAKMPGLALSPEDDAAVTAVYNRYKDVKHGVDERRAKHEAFDRDFWQLFSAKKYEPLVKVIVPEEYGEISPKHLHQFILEVEDQELRDRFMTLYYEALTADAKLPFAKKLADYFAGFMPKFSKTYVGEAPLRDAALVSHLDESFRKALNA